MVRHSARALRGLVRRAVLGTLVSGIGLLSAASAAGQVMLPPPAPPLPAPSGRIVTVSTVAQLQSAFSGLTSGTTVIVNPGVYRLTQELRFRNGVTNVALRGATNNRDDVRILGTGMNTSGVNVVIRVENAQDVLIANVSVGDVRWHPIQLQGEAGADRVRVYNVRLFDAGEQFLKSSVDHANPNGTDDVTVEYSLLEYTTIGPSHGYTEGIDVHHGANWIIRHNLFRNIRVPADAPIINRPAILMWSGSRNTQVYGNTFLECERAIIFGVGPVANYAHAHSGGSIVNNVIYRTIPTNADAGISLWDSPGTKVLHNTVMLNGTYSAAIEYRFPGTTGVEIANNLTDAQILRRDNAQATVYNNFTQATPAFFVNAGALDLHLAAGAAQAIDQGAAIQGVPLDFDGQNRPAGPLPDLGADERASATPNGAPTALFNAAPASGPAPLNVSFDARQSSDPEGQALSYAWTFGDGSTGTGVTATHTYATAASYTARLTVTDAAGASASTSVVITVSAGTSLLAPTNLSARVTGRTVTLQWTDQSTGELGYVVERAVGPTGSFTVVGQLGANATTFSDPRRDRTTYRYRVRAVGASGTFSPYSAIVQVRVG